jgi:hypothetical protein
MFKAKANEFLVPCSNMHACGVSCYKVNVILLKTVLQKSPTIYRTNEQPGCACLTECNTMNREKYA